MNTAPADAVIRRVSSRPDGMFGVLLLRRPTGLLPFCLTLEDPWNNNMEGMSCIPAGDYTCARVKSPAFGDTFTVLNVPGRTVIRWHWGNSDKDTRGCIILADNFDPQWDELTTVQASKVAFNRFLLAMAGHQSFSLRVEDVWGGNTIWTPTVH